MVEIGVELSWRTRQLEEMGEKKMCVIESQKLKDVYYLAGEKREWEALLKKINPYKTEKESYTDFEIAVICQAKEAIEEAIRGKE